MLDISKLSQVVSKYTPLLGSVLTFPGAVPLIDLILTRFRVSQDDEDQIVEKINENDEAEAILLDIQNNIMVELQQIAAVHAGNVLLTQRVKLQEETKRLEIERLSMDSARELAKISKIPAWLSTVVLVGFFGIMSLVVFVPIKSTDQNVLYILVGTLATNFSTVIAYWIGSSQSSKIKDMSLKTLLDDHDITLKSALPGISGIPKPNNHKEEAKQ